jgi:tRNA(Ile)-lysidine synthase
LLQDWSGDGLRQLVVAADPLTSLERTNEKPNPWSSGALQLDRLAQYSVAQRRWLLRDWLSSYGLKPPSQAVLAAIETQLIAARDDADPLIQIQGRSLKKYRQQLYCLDARSLQPAQACRWPSAVDALELSNGYRLGKAIAASGISRRLWDAVEVSICPRSGGEKLKLPGREGRHDLKKLFQEAGIPPWERQARPLVYLGDRLAGVAGLWVDEWAWSSGNEACYRLICEYPEREFSSAMEDSHVYGA